MRSRFAPSNLTPRQAWRCSAALFFALLQLATPTAQASGCWIDAVASRSAKASTPSGTQVGQMERLARDINSVFHKNPTLAGLPEGPEPIRLRTRASIANSYPEQGVRPLWMQLREHRKEMWTSGCGVNENSERIEPRASIVVHVDAPDQILERRALYDDQLTAWAEPPVTGSAAGRPIYFGWLVVLSANGQVPWMPLSMDEYLQYQERELLRASSAAERTRRSIERQDDATVDKKLLAVYENMKKFDPAAAEKMLADTRAQMKSSLPAARRNAELGTQISADRVSALKRFRATLTPAELLGQARHGWYEPLSKEELQRLPLLVKLNPAWTNAAGKPGSYRGPQLIALLIQGKGPFEAAMQEVMQTLDYSSLEQLLAKPIP